MTTEALLFLIADIEPIINNQKEISKDPATIHKGQPRFFKGERVDMYPRIVDEAWRGSSKYALDLAIIEFGIRLPK